MSGNSKNKSDGIFLASVDYELAKLNTQSKHRVDIRSFWSGESTIHGTREHIKLGNSIQSTEQFHTLKFSEN